MKKKTILMTVLLALLFILLTKTGFLQEKEIDKKDLAYWQYENEIIKKANTFSLEGKNTCWVMVHGYTSTPDELREVAIAINSQFNDSVFVPLLEGHGRVPSAILNYSVNQWYNQIEQTISSKNCTYLLGSSMGASLILKYAIEHPVKGIVLAGIPLGMRSALANPSISFLIPPLLNYLKRNHPGESIHDPTGRQKHITTFSFPLRPMLELQEFNKKILENLETLNSTVLFLFGKDDTSSDINEAKKAFSRINSKKELIILKGSHLIFRDYEKNKAIEETIKFRNTTT
ncbi:alpha/beta fold hydrolase [Candidatus Woesearchaeota archaeon]|nr:alpha/beta fold hydrolase [Candidatus Woesearchaeota archaeon]